MASRRPPATPSARRAGAPWLVYLLRCRDGSLYTGITTDLARRLAAHAAGRASRYTRSRLPVVLAHTEPQASHSLALRREAAIKRLPRLQKELLVARKDDAACAAPDTPAAPARPARRTSRRDGRRAGGRARHT